MGVSRKRLMAGRGSLEQRPQTEEQAQTAIASSCALCLLKVHLAGIPSPEAEQTPTAKGRTPRGERPKAHLSSAPVPNQIADTVTLYATCFSNTGLQFCRLKRESYSYC